MFRFKGNMLIYLYKCVNGCLSILSCFEMLERIIAKRIGGVSGNIALFGFTPKPTCARCFVSLFVSVTQILIGFCHMTPRLKDKITVDISLYNIYINLNKVTTGV